MSKKGFTLVELSIVLVIIAILAGMGLTASISTLNFAKRKQTEAKLDTVEKAIAGFVAVNGRLPCPANASLNINDANFGLEYCTGNHSATVTLPTGVTNEGSDNTVIAGAIPYVELALPLEFVTDGWDNRFTYIITRGMAGTGATYGTPTTPARFRGMSDGLITIEDSTGANRTNVAAFALISHGPNGFGAWPKFGGTQLGASSDLDEIENTHVGGTWNAIFVQKDFTETFDDIVRYKRKFQLDYRHTAMTNEYACDAADTVLESTSTTICTVNAGGTPGFDCPETLGVFAKELNDLCSGSR